MNKGYVAMLLHSHMPYVRHPEKEDSLEERWLFEGISECYLPMIQGYEKLVEENIDFMITMSITPTLMSMLLDPYLNKRYKNYLKLSIELSEKEIIRTRDDKELNKVAYFYHERLKSLYFTYKSYDYNIMNAFKRFDNLGVLEIITSSATHGLLPLLDVNIETVKAQLYQGFNHYSKSLGHDPKGIWLPECAYNYSLDNILKELGLKYFIMEGKGVTMATPKPIYGTNAPIRTESGVYAFGRDEESSKQVWSSFIGYPGDWDYREFYRDIGYELPLDYIEPYIDKSGIRIDTGIKYYRITNKSDHKEYYNRERAMEKVKNHSMHFLNSRRCQIEEISKNMNKPPIILCPYDTELFGHWWFEGPDFIYNFIKDSYRENVNYKLVTPSYYLENYTEAEVCKPNPSTWGENGDYSVWINPSNDWMYRHLHFAARKMINLANTYSDPTELEERALNQAARELMLAESSDWPFIIKNNTTAEYASERVNTHINRFNELYNAITKENIDESYLEDIEKMDNIFPDIDFRIYRSNK